MLYGYVKKVKPFVILYLGDILLNIYAYLNYACYNAIMENLIINIKNANVFIDSRQILHDINWQVKKGDKCFILGANGAGKTTLVKLLLGYIWPIYGATVEVLGKKYGETNLNELRKSIAWVSPFIQQHLSRELTGIRMVLSGPDGYLGFYRQASADELEKANELLLKLNATHLANKSIMSMSSGEQMKILIARALLTNPRLMILDEPNVYLDIKEREFLLASIKNLIKERPELTLIFISQRIEDILPEFDKGMILNSGKIDISGSREEILTEKNIKRAFDIDVKLVSSNSGRLWAICE